MSIWGCMFGTIFVIVAQIHCTLSHEFPSILIQNCQNNLKGQDEWPPFPIAAQNSQGCMFGANMVILAQICEGLSCRQGKIYVRTDRRTDAGNGNTILALQKQGINMLWQTTAQPYPKQRDDTLVTIVFKGSKKYKFYFEYYFERLVTRSSIMSLQHFTDICRGIYRCLCFEK